MVPDSFSPLWCDWERGSDVVEGATKRKVCLSGGGGAIIDKVTSSGMEVTLAAARLFSNARLAAASGCAASSGSALLTLTLTLTPPLFPSPCALALLDLVLPLVVVPPMLVIVVALVGLLISACNLASDLAMRRSCTRLRTFRSVSMGPRRDCEVPLIEPESESDSQTDCSPWATDVDVDGRPLVDALVFCLTIGAHTGAGFGTGLGQSCAGIKRA